MRQSNIPTENDSPSSSPEYTSSDDEASRESLGFSSIRLDNDSSMGVYANGRHLTAPTNFAGLGIAGHPQLSSSLPSTSNADGMPNDSQQSNSNNYSSAGRKRTFSTSESQPAGEKRTATKICRVCGDKAYSYNFNVITCESCKAFFRRNANKEKDIRCPFNDQCDINIVSRRFCQRCRLQKCFRVGMKKEWIMSEEARMEKKQRILDNRERRAAERKAEDRSYNNTSAEELAAAINATTQVQQLPPPPANPAPLALLPVAAAAAAAAANPFTATPTAALLQAAPPTQQPTTEVAQLVAQVAAVAQQHPAAAAAAVAAASGIPPTSFTQMPTQNDAGQMATERALAASIVANANAAAAAAPATNAVAAASAFANQQQQIVTQLAQAAQIQNQLHQQAAAQQIAVQAVQAAAVQAQAAQMVQQQHQAQQQLAAAVVAAATNSMTMVPQTAPAPPAVVTVPTLQSSAAVPTTIAPTTADPTDMVAVPRDVLIKLVEQKIESEQQAQQQPGVTPLKCHCRCSCGRYPPELLIVDKVMTDLLENSSKYNNSKPLGQLSPKAEQITPPTMMTTTPPSFFSQTQPHQTHPVVYPPICTHSHSTTMPAGLPIPMEEDYGFKQSQTGKVLLDSKMDESIVDPDCCVLNNNDIDVLHELQNANVIWDTKIDKKDEERHAQPSHSKLDLVNMADGAIRRLIKMSKRISAFRHLPYEDQMRLIKYNHMGCLILRGALSYIETENVWSGPSPKSNYSIRLDIMKESKFDLMSTSMNFYKSIRKEWRANETIIQVLVAICLFDYTTTDLQYHSDVRLHNLRYHSILKRKLYMLCEKDASKTCHEYDLLMKNLLDLRNLSMVAFQFVNEVRDGPVEPLVREMMLANPA